MFCLYAGSVPTIDTLDAGSRVSFCIKIGGGLLALLLEYSPAPSDQVHKIIKLLDIPANVIVLVMPPDMTTNTDIDHIVGMVPTISRYLTPLPEPPTKEVVAMC